MRKIQKVAPRIDFTVIADHQTNDVSKAVHTTKPFHGKSVALTHSSELTLSS